MAVTENMLIDIQVKSGNSQKNVEQVSGNLSDLTKSIEQTNQSLKSIERSFASLGLSFNNVAGQISTNSNEMKEGFKSLDTEVAKSQRTWDAFLDASKVAAFAAATGALSYQFDAVKQSVKPALDAFNQVGLYAGKAIKILGKSLPTTIWGITEAAGFAAPALIGLGSAMQSTDSIVLDTLGTITKFAGFLAGGLVAAIGLAIGWIGNLSISLGEKLMRSVTANTEAFIKFETVISQFNFTVANFGKTFGEDVVGSLDYWNKQMEEVYSTTVFTRDQIAKSIKMLVAEGQVIGMTAEENSKLLQRSADIAAATGRDLYEVTQMVVSGLTNNADAVLSLGIDIRNTAVSHTEFAKNAGIAIEQMDSQQLAMARLATLYERTIPLVGSAAHQTKTVAGATTIYEKTLKDIQIKLGETGAATEAYYVTLTKFADFFAKLPTPILSFVGNLKDLAGVLLIIIGNILKVSVAAFATLSIIKLLNFALAETIGMSISLSAMFGYLLKVILPTIVVFIAIKDALDDLMGTSEAFSSTVKDIGRSFGMFKNELREAKDEASIFTTIITKTWSLAVNTVKLVIIGLAQAINQLGVVIVKFKSLFTNDKETLDYYDYSVQELETRIAGLTKESDKAYKVINVFGSGVAMAAENTTKMSKSVAEVTPMAEKFRAKVIDLAKKINEGFDINIERQRALGNEFEKATAEYKQAQNELDNVFKTKSSERDTAQKYAEAEKRTIQASLEIDRLRLDTIKKIVEQRRTIELEILRSQGRNIEAIKRERDEQLKNIDEQIAGIKTLKGFKQEELKALEETRKAIAKSGDIKIQEERIKSLQKAVDAEKFLADIKRESAQLDKNVIADLKSRVEGRQQELSKMEQALKASNDFYGRSKLATQEAKKQIDAMFDTGLARIQADQLKELGTQRQQLEDSINKEILTQAENIELSYQKELQLLEVTKMRIEEQGYMNDQIRKQFEDMDSLLQKQKDIQLKKAPGQEAEALEKTGADIAGSITGAFSTGALGMVTGAMGMVSAVVDVVDKILDFVPQLINKIADIFDKITQLPMVLLSSIKNLARAITQSITDALPNLMKALPEIIDVILTLLFEGIPDAIDNLIAQLPDLIQMVADRLPELVEKLVAGLISNSPRIAISLTMAMIKLLPMLWREMFKYFLKLPKIIVNGIVEGLKQLVNIFKGISIKGPDTKKMVENLQLGMKSVTKTLTGESSKLFSVMDLGTASKAQEAIDTMKDQIYEGAKKGVDYLTMWWRKLLAELQKLWDGLVSAWRKVWEWISQVWGELVRAGKAIFEFLKMVWDEVIKALQPIFDGLKAMWEWVLNKLGEIWAGVKALWEWIISSLQSAWNSLTEAWNKITEGLSSVWEKLKGVGSSIWESFKEAVSNGFNFFKDLGSKIWEGLKSGLAGIGDFVQDIFNKLNPMNLFERIFKIDMKGKGTVESALNIDVPFANFAKGGLVPGNPIVKGDSFLNDRILALLSPGEAIIPRSLMEDPATKAVINSVLSGQISPLGLWKGGISIGGQNIISVGDKGISVGDTTISSANDLLDAAGQAFGNFWGKVKEEVYGMVMKMFEANKFHTGGLVPAFAGGGEVPAMLNPGEFVLNRSATQGLGLNLLNSMNRGSGGMVEPNITLNIEINTTQPIDDVFFRNTLMPRIKDDIKRRTLNGEFIISSKGVR